MEDNNFYQKFDGKNNSGTSFKNTFIFPFISGMFATLLTFLILFGIPGIRNNIFNITEASKEASSKSVVTQVSSNSSQISLSDYSNTAIYAANKVLPSIVGITVEYSVNSFGMTGTAEATGSGIIITEDGYILTNNHIVSSTGSSYYSVSEATSVLVSLYNDNESTYEAKIIGTDSQTDLAIIKIDANNLVAAELGDSSNIQVGEFVLAIGNPLGLNSTVTSGIVSALNRTITSDNVTYTVIQTDCAINSGNSGGALVNSMGQVIGVNTLKFAGTGIEGVGFAIPINSTIEVYEELISYGKVLRPYIGISGTNITEAISDRYNLPIGVYVESVDNNSGAYAAGIKQGDVITKIDGTEITSMDELNKIKNSKNIKDTVILTIYRKGKYEDVSVVLFENP